MQTRVLGLLAVPALAIALAGCGGGGGSASDGDSPSTTSSAPSTSASTSASSPVSAPSSTTTLNSSTGAVVCTYTKSGSAARPVNLPPSTPAYTAKTPATITTSAGVLHVTLDGDTAPCTVNSFASLASQGFYDKTPCPRLTTAQGFDVLQCGDPTGTLRGGPGYSFDDELSGNESYPAGTLAMANAGPNTNGSQFFVVYGDTTLSPNYTVFGSVATADLSVVKAVAAKGEDDSNGPGDGKPNEPISITSVTVGS